MSQRGNLGNYVRTIRQFMTAGNQFDKSEPSASGVPVDPVYKNGQLEYRDLDRGGIFDFPVSYGHEVKRIAFDLADATDWTLYVHILQLDGSYREFELEKRSVHLSNKILLSKRDLTIFQPGDLLVLQTTGATTAMVAEIDASKW